MLQREKGRLKIREVIVFFILLVTVILLTPHHAKAAKKVYIAKGEMVQLAQGATRWKSSKKSVAKVNQAGYVLGRNRGTSTVTCRFGGKKKSFKVIVEAPVMNASSLQLEVGKTFTLRLKNTSKKYKFSSSDPSVVGIKRKSKNKYLIKGFKNGTATITATFNRIQVTCTVTVGTGATTVKSTASTASSKTGLQTLYMDGNVFKEMTWNRSDVAIQVSNVSRYGQSAPLYIHKDGGDGLENIWAAENNGAVEVPGAQLSPAEIQGTVAKACAWASAVCNSPYHGYDMYAYSPWGDIFGQAKANALGTGDYTCFSIPLCAYYFAGVNVLGENLGGPNATYIPNTTLLWYTGYVSFWNNGNPIKIFCPPYADWAIYERCGFTNITSEYKKDRSSFVFQPGDVLIYESHAQMVVQAGTLSTALVAQAHGYGSDTKHIGGDQGSELTVSKIFRKKDFVWVERFTGQGVRLNTVGLNA